MISSFCFNYKKVEYIVLVILFLPDEHKKDEYSLLKMRFLDAGDSNRQLLVEANSARLNGDAKEIREFFRIEYGENLGDKLRAFYEHLGKFVPKQVSGNTTDSQKKAMVRELSCCDSEDETKIYCYMVKRNPKRDDGTNGQRSPFNDNKTRLLRPKLYEKLKDDSTLSFCYSDDPQKCKSDEEILMNWASGYNG